jgi:hypothetical protein
MADMPGRYLEALLPCTRPAQIVVRGPSTWRNAVNSELVLVILWKLAAIPDSSWK